MTDPATVPPKGHLESIRQRAHAALGSAPRVVALGGLVLIVLLKIPWPAPFDVLGSGNAVAVGTVIISVVLVELAQKQHEIEAHQRQLADQQIDLPDQVSQRLTGHEEKLADQLSVIADEQRSLVALLSPSARRYFPDPVAVYGFLGPIAAKIDNESDKRLDIMGTTLSGAWAPLHSWLVRPEAVGWRVRVASFSDASGRLKPWIDPSWADEANAYVRMAHRVAASPDLRRRGVEIDLYEYDFFPAVRGARLGNGDLVIALMSWQPDGLARPTSDHYEYIPHNEETRSAVMLRELFASWFDRALDAARQPAPPAGTPATLGP